MGNQWLVKVVKLLFAIKKVHFSFLMFGIEWEQTESNTVGNVEKKF